jgi:hypothetical protein
MLRTNKAVWAESQVPRHQCLSVFVVVSDDAKRMLTQTQIEVRVLARQPSLRPSSTY